MGKARGQTSILDGVYIRTNRPTNRLVERLSYFVLQKETRLNAWFISTSLPPTMKRSTKP